MFPSFSFKLELPGVRRLALLGLAVNFLSSDNVTCMNLLVRPMVLPPLPPPPTLYKRIDQIFVRVRACKTFQVSRLFLLSVIPLLFTPSPSMSFFLLRLLLFTIINH